MPRILFLMLFPGLLLLGGCFSAPPQAQLIGSSGQAMVATTACSERLFDPATDKSLPADGFSLASWNIYKQGMIGWQKDLARLSADADILLLQEAWLQPALRVELKQANLEWEMSPGFQYRGAPAGVIIASKSSSSANCSLVYREPHIYLPKAVLLSYYPIEGRLERLLVVNVHSVNFSVGTKGYAMQLQSAKNIMDSHAGPMVLAGDFNTWSDARMTALNTLSQEMGMEVVYFEGQQPAEHIGRVVDHIYFKGLTAIESKVLTVESSDHYPLEVRFVLDDNAI
ncbi:MAG: endonuclease/exonuclease/phosphatase family protein [Pseudomonadales bacterium]